MTDAWNPTQYHRFAAERSQPFFDLLAMVEPLQGRAIDLGCGTGELTQKLHEKLKPTETLGLDSSEAMLAKARPLASETLRFIAGDLASPPEGPYALIFSNAAVHWTEDHPRVLATYAQRLAPGGQLAIQMPANFDHPSHTEAAALAQTSPYREALGGYVRTSPVLAPERYAELLFALGFGRPRVRLEVYGHTLASTDEVVEWVKGTLLTDYESRMPAALFPRFLADYRARLRARLGEHRPYFYAFKRLLMHARK